MATKAKLCRPASEYTMHVTHSNENDDKLFLFPVLLKLLTFSALFINMISFLIWSLTVAVVVIVVDGQFHFTETTTDDPDHLLGSCRWRSEKL